VQVGEGRGGKTVQIVGENGGVSSELFSILEESGAPKKCYPEGEVVRGKYITSISEGFTGNQFSTVLAIDAHSAVTYDGELIHLAGQAAQELYDQMDKAGLNQRPQLDGNVILGRDVSCSVHYLGGARFGCNIRPG
jgi:hypothetical protein